MITEKQISDAANDTYPNGKGAASYYVIMEHVEQAAFCAGAEWANQQNEAELSQLKEHLNRAVNNVEYAIQNGNWKQGYPEWIDKAKELINK